MGRAPNLKNKARALARTQETLRLLVGGFTISDIASKLGVSVQTTRTHLHQALASQSTFPNTLDREEVAQLRQVQAERLNGLHRQLNVAAVVVRNQLANPDPELALSAACSLARLSDSTVRVSERISRLFGLDQPTKIVEESLRVAVSRQETRVTISFDAGAFDAEPGPIPGLEINPEPSSGLPNPGAFAVAEKLSGDGTS